MFDVGFSELALVFGVSLAVLGPKRLPGLVRKVGRWVGKARSMARDFQQQLENEVNLEELNRMTERTAQEAMGTTPSPPPFTGDPPPDSPPPTYPYSAQESTPVQATVAPDASAPEPVAEIPQTDDSWSHAHGAGDAPMPDVAEHAAADNPSPPDHWYRPDLDQPQEPVQADLDLAEPDHSHLPPDDARRYT